MDTPTLSTMGIANAGQISRYTLRQRSPREDVLKIHYRREKGSLLPVSRTYEFGRSPKTVVADSGEPRFEDTYEISPALLGAVAELDALLEAKGEGGRGGAGSKRELLDELVALRERLAAGTLEDPTEIAERLDRLSERLERM